MINLLKKNYLLLGIFSSGFLIYFKSLFSFFTNDDFFLLKISRASSVAEFINFFNLLQAPDGLGMYRPLTTQAFYFLGWKVFNLNPIGLHIIVFLVFFLIIFLVYKITRELVPNKNTAMIAAFLYATSATHFGHLYYLATFQELGMTLFVLLSIYSFIFGRKILSFTYFIAALGSKETAIITPALLLIVYLYQKNRGFKVSKLKKLINFFIPFVVVIAAYFYLRVAHYGFATGDSYIWDFSLKRLFNTYTWYVLWAFNLPETLIDFIGPGFVLNADLFKYWYWQFIQIFFLFFLQLSILSYLLIKAINERKYKNYYESNRISTLSIVWFIVSLLPVAFLPIHKFSFYLTLPLVGFVIRIAYLITKYGSDKILKILILFVWVVLSILTVRHSVNTGWITGGEKISKSVHEFFKSNADEFVNGAVFIDAPEDMSLPWSPTNTVKTALSDKNFFMVFYPGLTGKVYYGVGEGTQIRSRQFLGY